MFSPPTSFWNKKKKWSRRRKALCTISDPTFWCGDGGRLGIWKAPSRLWLWFSSFIWHHFTRSQRESIHLVQVLGRLGAGGSVALSQETRIVTQMPPLTSCLILNKLLCLSGLIFLICQVKWRLWNRWSLKNPSSSTVLFWVCLHLQTVMWG